MSSLLRFVFFLFFLVFQIAYGFNIDTSQTSVSGLSSGGFIAVQFHFAFSSSIIGAGIFAAGPYYCAQGSVTTAQTTCLYFPTQINVNSLLQKANTFASNGEIDPLSNLKGQNVYLYSGTRDTVVNQGVVKKLQTMYEQVSVTVTTEYSVQSQHCLPTLDFGNQCLLLASPYINKCDYDGAGEALLAIYKGSLKSPVSFNNANIITLKQQSFIPSGRSSLGVAPNAFAYIPTACQTNGTLCGLHVSFHGCNQNYEAIQDDYYANGGFNTWAEANNIIVLYPQADSQIGSNPQGCFDWWGFTGDDYAFKTAVQMATTWNMISYLAQSNVTMSSS